jgi:hypothetical protein
VVRLAPVEDCVGVGLGGVDAWLPSASASWMIAASRTAMDPDIRTAHTLVSWINCAARSTSFVVGSGCAPVVGSGFGGTQKRMNTHQGTNSQRKKLSNLDLTGGTICRQLLITISGRLNSVPYRSWYPVKLAQACAPVPTISKTEPMTTRPSAASDHDMIGTITACPGRPGRKVQEESWPGYRAVIYRRLLPVPPLPGLTSPTVEVPRYAPAPERQLISARPTSGHRLMRPGGREAAWEAEGQVT